MAMPEKPKSGCFTGFLRVLLCAGNASSPPVHPSDHFTEYESENAHSTKETVVVNDGSTPGVVARLMGLDSLPNPKWVLKGGTPDSVPRSRSVNFVDFLLEFDSSRANHRRVKTSASFREVPGLVENQNIGNNLFVLCMDADKDRELRHELTKLETSLGEVKKGKRQGSRNKETVSVKKERNEGKNKKISKLRNEPRRIPSSTHEGRNHEDKDLSSVSSTSSKCSSCSNRQNNAGSRSRLNTSLANKHKKGLVDPKEKNMRKKKLSLKVESECSLENHSAVSVVDSNHYPFLYGTNFLGSNSKRESPSLLSMDADSASTDKDYTFIDVNKEAEYFSELLLQIRTLAEDDVRESDCTSKHIRESESFRDICFVFELKILDHLLYEVVDEISELYCCC